MMSKLKLKLLLILYFVANFSYGQEPGPGGGSISGQTRQEYLYRHINWCIIGKGEYPLNVWPLNQFRPILEMTRKNEKQYDKANEEKIKSVNSNGNGSDPWDKYQLMFSPITCEKLKDSGFGDPENNNHLQRVHIVFKPKSDGDSVPFQGLLIQAVHAPFGLGFPFGVFDNGQEFKCSDCNYQHFSKIVGCISRPDISPMHPTVAIYHFKLRNYTLEHEQDETSEGGSGIDASESPGSARRSARQATPAPPPGPGPGPSPSDPSSEEKSAIDPEYGIQKELHWNFKWANIHCASARHVEFWVLMVLDFERRAWTIQKFGPYNFNELDFSTKLEEPKKVEIDKKEVFSSGLPTPIIPDCYPPKTLPLPIDEAKGRPRTCFRNFQGYDAVQCRRWTLKKLEALTAASTEKNLIKCEDGQTELTANTTNTRIRVVGDFDVQCVVKYPGQWWEMLHPGAAGRMRKKKQPGKVCQQWQGRYECEGSYDEWKLDKQVPAAGPDNPDREFPLSFCDICKPLTERVTEPPDDSEPFFKRGIHGTLMIFAFFFFNPVSINIARFYKETLHEGQLKGWRWWLLIHVAFAVTASIFAYIGYTFPSFVESDAHIDLGYGALICIMSGIISGWIRHKNYYIKLFMFFLHALSGYLGWALAIASMVFAPFITSYTRLISYIASGICLGAMAIMTIHICLIDHQVGVRPKRPHIPIIRTRFEDIILPQSTFRKVFLYIYIALQFIICFLMLIL